MKRKKVNLLTFWIVGAVFVCYSVGSVQATGAYPSTSYVNTPKHSKIQITRPKFGASGFLDSWVQVNDINLPTDLATASGGLRNILEANSTFNGDKKSNRVKRRSGGVEFECVALNNNVKRVTKTSVGPCVEYCWTVRKTLALLQRNDQCSCINNNDDYTVVDISKCNTKCTDEKKQNCGGEYNFGKYRTGYIREPRFNRDSETAVRKARQDCFRLIKDPKAPSLDSLRMHPHICMEFCSYKQNRYAALSKGTFCQCLNFGNGYFAPAKDKCSKLCRGDRRYNCGGENNVYQVYSSGYLSSQKKNSDIRFDDLSWSRPDRRDPEDYEFLNINKGGGYNGNGRRKRKKKRKGRRKENGRKENDSRSKESRKKIYGRIRGNGRSTDNDRNSDNGIIQANTRSGVNDRSGDDGIQVNVRSKVNRKSKDNNRNRDNGIIQANTRTRVNDRGRVNARSRDDARSRNDARSRDNARSRVNDKRNEKDVKSDKDKKKDKDGDLAKKQHNKDKKKGKKVDKKYIIIGVIGAVILIAIIVTYVNDQSSEQKKMAERKRKMEEKKAREQEGDE
ncbi:hypothetical protein LOTGIDRAFT_232549 [Lottia gigantea]|uniref:WSC domain-containing protein n=1 Tax=Lottia gigantea TaxID=225164 RepID=V4ABX3_LOTGI|nr:hypothetical protein LOTGIDRAFT_232549 [Lottia gigantea]ESO94317.1 hypothetical protein LOTGIDRAFT_232549 [Lottia gigantea]